jgi:hypothetical protein
MRQAIEADGAGQRALLAGERDQARAAFARAAALYRRSWEQAPPASYGRLVGMLKSAVLADSAGEAAAYARAALSSEDAERSPVAAYALALAALIDGDEGAAAQWAERMRSGGSDALARTAAAITALARGDAAGYAEAARAIVRDFEGREQHLTGVAIADTAVMLERLAAARGIAAALSSPLLPSAG